MSKLSKSFVQSTGEILQEEDLKVMVGETFPQFEAVVKAAIGINDVGTLTKIIMTLIPGLDIPGYMAIRDALSEPMTKIIIARNSAEISADEQ
jgi:hypothetical protein